ncbi:MAG: family 43 glycosylhydrolase [Colwellia sp.]
MTLFYSYISPNFVFGAPTQITTGGSFARTNWNKNTNDNADNRKSLRIDASVFVDDIDNDGLDPNDPVWFTYNWFGNGNNISTFQWSGDSVGSDEQRFFNNVKPNWMYDEGIAEAGDIFEKEGWYYLVYSENWYTSKYQLYYKAASSVQELNGATNSHKLSPVPTHVWDNNKNEFGYPKNAGHGSVIQVDNEYYLIFHVGSAKCGKQYIFKSDGDACLQRDTYIEKLNVSNGVIESINFP